MSFMLLGILNSQVSASGGSYELISSQILTSSVSSVTFSSIPSDYKHLQIRAVMRSTDGGSLDLADMRYNSDSGSNYTRHRLTGNGSAVDVTGSGTGENKISLAWVPGSTATASAFAVAIADILDYASTSKYTTTRVLHGAKDTNQNITLVSGLWLNSSAITTIAITPNGGSNWAIGTRFSLFGVKG